MHIQPHTLTCSMRPARPQIQAAKPQDAASLRAAATSPAPAEEDDDGKALKRAFVWGGSAAVIGGLASAATTAAYVLAGPGVGYAVRMGLTAAAGIGGAWYLGNHLHSEPPGNRFMGALAAGGAMALATTLGAQAGMSATPGFMGLAAAQASAGFGVVYGGFGSLILGDKGQG